MKRRKFFRVFGIVGAAFSIIPLLTAEITIGIIMLIIGGFFILMSVLPDKALMTVNELSKHITADNTFFIEYTDFDGNFTSRNIDIKRVYKKNGEKYIDAFCYLADDDRTFRVDRIKSISYDGKIIDDIDEFLKSLKKKSGPKLSAENLAALAAEDDNNSS